MFIILKNIKKKLIKNHLDLYISLLLFLYGVPHVMCFLLSLLLLPL